MANFIGFKKLEQALTRHGVITPAVAAELGQRQFATSAEFFAHLAVASQLPESELFGSIAQVIDFPYTNLVGKDISADVLGMLPFDIAQRYQAIAFAHEGSTIKIGLTDPYNAAAIEAIDFLTQQKKLTVEYHLISPKGFGEALGQYSDFGQEVEEALKVVDESRQQVGTTESVETPTEISQVISQAPVSRIVSEIVKHGMKLRASDIHIEPVRNGSRVRLRIDGVLQDALTLPAHVHAAVIARIKVLSSLRLDETRVPQDGRITLALGNQQQADFRVSIMPLLDSEKAVLRILKTDDAVPSLSDLGFQKFHQQVMEDSIKRPHGLFLISGPTGSGKSTTLYSLLHMLDSKTRNVVTLEDPIEFYLPGVNQSQIRPDVEFTFSSGLRALLRQDPDIIMVGEVRDAQTAEMAIHAGLTGHLIFSTIHTNDALGVVPRLMDMHVEPFLLASTLNTMVAQRLVRRVCQKCKQPVQLPDYIEKKVIAELDAIDPQKLPSGVDIHTPTFYEGRGCPACNQTGYSGRLAIAEIIQATEQLRSLIVAGYPIEQVKAEVARQKAVSLMQDGLLWALAGVTTVEEVLRVTNEE